MDLKQPVDAAGRGGPWLMLAAVGLLVAKFGFGVPIPLLWALAPLWVPVAVILTVTIAALLIFGFSILVTFGIAHVVDKYQRWDMAKKRSAGILRKAKLV